MYKFKNCLVSKNIQNLKMFKLKNCLHFKIGHILKLFILEKKAKKMEKLEKKTGLNKKITEQQKENRRRPG
jgi:hypothetical protein